MIDVVEQDARDCLLPQIEDRTVVTWFDARSLLMLEVPAEERGEAARFVLQIADLDEVSDSIARRVSAAPMSGTVPSFSCVAGFRTA